MSQLNELFRLVTQTMIVVLLTWVGLALVVALMIFQ